ncbi:hypothetical protein SLG_25120 [Sphingobium sp. SYK-6]|uniref:hypothetical protein n=1 Tax=Sphingobium sp. (strain NBRC 103272 / SYK-6) TaxID=627192 RepID=UPI000227758E|nr:hypothetical protein [Sphingobium sp. SYK-6]BAK67187.1 hypothetical protein SLG_25120 [Sphingobium sp. SYK-6]
MGLRKTIATALLSFAAIAASPALAQVSCDRACLEGVAAGFMAAMDAKDPAKVPVAAGFHYTENSVPLTLGDGFWATYQNKGSYSRYFADVPAGQVVWFGTAREADRPVLVSLRLKVVDRKVAEAEMLIYRNAEHVAKLEARAKMPAFDEALPKGQRPSRDALVKAADSYFNGLTSGAPVAFTSDCNRVENGIQTTNNPEHKSPSFPDPAFNPFNMTCDQNMKTGLWRYIQRVEPRRYVLVDEERGNVVGMFMFVHPGTIREVDSPTHGKVAMPANARIPSHVLIAEAFNIRDNSIRAIEAVEVGLPYGQPDGWQGR